MGDLKFSKIDLNFYHKLQIEALGGWRKFFSLKLSFPEGQKAS